MSDGVERLKDIGAQKIYEKTHIPVECVQAILYESFEGMNKVHFLGFVSILEREYGEDLSAVREHGIEYFKEDTPVEPKVMFQVPKEKQHSNAIYYILAIIVIVFAAIYALPFIKKQLDVLQQTKVVQVPQAPQKKEKIVVTEKNTTEINSTKKSMILKSDINDTNVTEPQKVVAKKVLPPKPIEHRLKIVTKRPLWVDYIEVATNKKHRKTLKGSLTLDAKKEWLLYFGKNSVTILLDGKEKKFSSQKRVRLHYKDGKIEKISLNEFKKLNRGSVW